MTAPSSSSASPRLSNAAPRSARLSTRRAGLEPGIRSDPSHRWVGSRLLHGVGRALNTAGEPVGLAFCGGLPPVHCCYPVRLTTARDAFCESSVTRT